MSEDDRTEEQILKDNLIAQLADKGVTADRRYSVAKLQEMLGNTVLEVPVNDEPGPEPEVLTGQPEAPSAPPPAPEQPQGDADKVAKLETLVAQLMEANQRQQQQLAEVRLGLPDDVKEEMKAAAKRSMRPVNIRITKKGHNKVHKGDAAGGRYEWNDETTVPEYVGLELEERGFAEII